MDDNYGLLFPNEEEEKRKQRLTFGEDSDSHDKVIIYLTIIATGPAQDYYQFFRDKIVVASLKAFQSTIINDKTNPIICTFTSADEALLALKIMFKKGYDDNQQRNTDEHCYLQAALHFGSILQMGNDISGETVNVTTKIHAVADRNLILLSKQIYDLVNSHKKKCLFLGEFHFKGTVEKTTMFGFLWLDHSDWLNNLYEEHKKILAKGDTSQYKLISDKEEDFHFAPLAALTIETIPTACSVWLDSIKIQQKTPFTINHKVGECQLKIEKDGYKTFTRTIDIEQNKQNQFSYKLTSARCSFSIETDEPGYAIIFDGEELKQKTPYKLINLKPGAHTIELYGKDHYTNPVNIVLKEAEDFHFKPTMIPFGSLVITSKIRDIDFMIKNSVSYEKIKINANRFTYTPDPDYKKGKNEVIFLKKGTYIIEPLDNKMPEMQVEIKSGELNIVSYDKEIPKRKTIINTGKYHTRVIYKHEKTGQSDNIHVKGTKRLKFLPGPLDLKIQSKLVTKEYKIDLNKGDVTIDFFKDIKVEAKKYRKKVIGRSVWGLFFIAILLVGVYFYAKFENKVWEKVQTKDTISAYEDYLNSFYFFRFKKLARSNLARFEEKYWQITQQMNTIDSYERYIDIYKEPKYLMEARKRHSKLLWNDIQKDPTLPVVKKFRDMYAESLYYPQVDSLFQRMNWQDVKNRNSVFIYTYFIHKYPDNIHVSEAKMLRQDVLLSLNRGDFWIDKWHDLKRFIVSPDNLKSKLIAIFVLFLLFLIIYFRRRR